MAKRDAGHRADLPALILELVKQGRDQPAVVGDVEPAVVRLDPTDQLRGALRRIRISVQDAADRLDARSVDLVGGLPLQVTRGLVPQWTWRPGVEPGDLGIVPPFRAVGRNLHELPIHVLGALVVRRAGDDEAILGRSVRVVILEEETRPLPFGVNLARPDDGRGLGRGPVQAIKPDDEHIFCPSCDSVSLDPVEVALVGVNGLRVDGILGNGTVRHPDLRLVSIPAVRSHHGAKVGLAPVNIHADQPVGVAGVVGKAAACPLRAKMIGPGLFLSGILNIAGLQRLEHVRSLDLGRSLRSKPDGAGSNGQQARKQDCSSRCSPTKNAEMTVNQAGENCRKSHLRVILRALTRRTCRTNDARTMMSGAGPVPRVEIQSLPPR